MMAGRVVRCADCGALRSSAVGECPVCLWDSAKLERRKEWKRR